MNIRTLLMLLSMIWATLFFFSCEPAINKESSTIIEVHKTEAEDKLMNLLASIENNDIEALEKIMSNSEEMDLIFTNGSILPSIDSFVEFHRSWFLDTTWTITHEVIDFKFYENFATSKMQKLISK